MNRLVKSFIFLCVVLGLVSCGEEKAKENESKEPSYCELNKQQMDLMSIQTATAEEKDIKTVIYANGFVAAKPNLEAKVTSNISGRIEKIFVLEGSIVKKGEPLMSISSLEFIQMQQDYMSAYQDVVFLEKEYNRQSELRKADVGSVADYQSIESKYYGALGLEKALRSKLLLLGVDVENLKEPKTAIIKNEKYVVSPISGYVYALPVSIGTRADLGVVLANVIDLSELFADIFCYEKDLDKIAEDEEVEIEFVNKRIPKVNGKIKYIERSVDENSRSVTVHTLFKAPPGFLVLPEMAIQAKIKSKLAAKPSLAVPISSIFEENDYSYVFLVTSMPNNKFKLDKIKVKTGNNDGQFVEILSSTKEFKGQTIASTNVFVLDSEYKKWESTVETNP